MCFVCVAIVWRYAMLKVRETEELLWKSLEKSVAVVVTGMPVQSIAAMRHKVTSKSIGFFARVLVQRRA